MLLACLNKNEIDMLSSAIKNYVNYKNLCHSMFRCLISDMKYDIFVCWNIQVTIIKLQVKLTQIYLESITIQPKFTRNQHIQYQIKFR